MFLHRNCSVQKRLDLRDYRPTIERQQTSAHAVYQKVSFSVTLSDPDFEVTAFFEVEYLWSRLMVMSDTDTDQVFEFAISNMHTLRGFVSIS